MRNACEVAAEGNGARWLGGGGVHKPGSLKPEGARRTNSDQSSLTVSFEILFTSRQRVCY